MTEITWMPPVTIPDMRMPAHQVQTTPRIHMRTEFKTAQERFWAGTFGDDYAERNKGKGLLAANIALFSEILAHTEKVDSVLEFGANIGMNLLAIKQLRPEAELSAIEINETAAVSLAQMEGVQVYAKSVLHYEPDHERDFVFSKGLLIHINPNELERVYDLMYRSSRRYVCVTEYYNPSPVEVSYRGHEGKLFKRDFAGEMLDTYPDLTLLHYGFVYHRNSHFPQDDMTWLLMEKR
jgi:spore coat polysaccharide biosynthesis protein SpsF